VLAQARSSKLPLPFVRQRSRLACNAGSCINLQAMPPSVTANASTTGCSRHDRPPAGRTRNQTLIAALNYIAGRTPAQVAGLANDTQYKKVLGNVL